MRWKDADGMANSVHVDPDYTAPLGAVWSGSALFGQACLSKNLGTLRNISLSTSVAGLIIGSGKGALLHLLSQWCDQELFQSIGWDYKLRFGVYELHY